MPSFNWSALADWIQIAASGGVVVGFALLIVYIAYTSLFIEPEQTNEVYNPALETRRVYLGEITNERQSELLYFVEQKCPACHGIGMRGSIGPALSKANLQHLSVNAVTLTILYGLPEKGMPAWEAQLSEREASWIAELLKRGGKRLSTRYTPNESK